MDIQVLSPVREGVLGVKSLKQSNSTYCKSKLLMKKMPKSSKALSFIAGDKVMQTDNNYELRFLMVIQVLSRIMILLKIRQLLNLATLNFRIEEKEYDKKILNQLDLAYCITIHKSQGSDYPYIILPIYNKHYYQLYTKLFIQQ